MSRLLAGFAILAALALTGAGLWVGFGQSDSGSDVSAETITLGRSLYAEHCASCHGANLEGHPDGGSGFPTVACQRRHTTPAVIPGTIPMKRCSASPGKDLPPSQVADTRAICQASAMS